MIPFGDVCRSLELRNQRWSVQVGEPEGDGWIRGADLQRAGEGPLQVLLMRIAERSRAGDDRKTVAAGFALRYAWSSGAAMAPLFLYRSVPDIGLDNVSLKFTAGTLFERVALHDARAVARDEGERALLRALRAQLVAQAEGVVEALYAWSGFSRRGIWGQITSSWGAQLVHVLEDAGRAADAVAIAAQLFDGDDLPARMQPYMYPVTLDGLTQIHHRRASCCRYYLLPTGQLCASCPLVAQEERVERNREWMRRTPRPPTGC